MPRPESRPNSIPPPIVNGGPATTSNTRKNSSQKGSHQPISVVNVPSRVNQNDPPTSQNPNGASDEETPRKDQDSSSVYGASAGKADNLGGETGFMKFLHPKFMFKKGMRNLTATPSQENVAPPISKKGWRRLKKETQTVKIEELKETDIVIALMGPTGSGKSSFISMIADADQGVGHNLMSCTNEINAVRVRVPDEDIDIVLVDTPGFDDTYKSDYEILQMISEWIKQVGYKNILLDGILYLHRITDNRMAGTPLRNLEIFEKICGPQALARVVLMTTMWDDLESEEMGELREEELKTTFWYPMISRGSKAVRYRNGVDSAWEVLDRFLDAPRERLKAIQLQKETVKQQKTLNKTDAGQELYNKLDELDKKRRMLIRQLEKQIKRAGANEEIVGILQRQHDELEEQRKKAVGELQGLKVTVPQRFLKSFAVKTRYR